MIDRETRHNPDEMGELAASLMGPGPWKFHRDLKLPSKCGELKFTNKNLKANVRVTHLLKVVMRLEKPQQPLGAEDPHTIGNSKKPSLFDVVVQTPVVILSVSIHALVLYKVAFFLLCDANVYDSAVVTQIGSLSLATLKSLTIRYRTSPLLVHVATAKSLTLRLRGLPLTH